MVAPLFWAIQKAGVNADIICAAKGLTGGSLPMAFTAVTPQIYSAFEGEYGSDRILNHGHTFTGNPITSAAACAALSVIVEETLPHSSLDRMRYFSEGLITRFLDHKNVGDVRSIGMIGAIEFVADKLTNAKFGFADRTVFSVCQDALSRGLLVRPLGDTMYFVPTLLISKEQIDFMLDVALAATNKVLGQ